MPDVFSKSKRSEVMSRIRSRGNAATELAFARILRAEGITGWRRHRRVFGKPDFIFPGGRVAVFVDGCFWHGCPRCYRRPGTRQKFWDAKIARNRERDRVVGRELRRRGWRVVRVWEHALRRPGGVVARLRRALGEEKKSGVHHRGTEAQRRRRRED